jgi:hypothetical protein
MNVDKVYKLSTNPLIFAGNGNCIKKLKKEINYGGMILLWHPSWMISIKSVLKLLKTQFNFKSKGNKFIICCNSKFEYNLCKIFGLNAKLFNQNMHECEHEFMPLETQKIYDAFYTAQAKSFKRMHLASMIKKLYILTYGCKGYTNDEGNDLSLFEPLISHASWNKTFIYDREKISKLKCSSNCGLALSRKEGAMWASVQYLLCGIPLVTTPSKGGRDYFYDDDYVVLVKDNPKSILEGVNLTKNRVYNPYKIRNKVLEKMIKHRYEYLDFIIDNFLNKESNRDELYDFIWGSEIGIKQHLYEHN